VLIPGAREREETDRVIFQELGNGVVTKGAKELFMGIVGDFVDRGVECVVLACTDLIFVIKQEDVDVPLFETTEIHAEGVAEWALMEERAGSG
jgi:aspartate racemase